MPDQLLPRHKSKAQELCLSMIYAPAPRRRRMTCVKGISRHAKTGRRVDCATTSGRAYAAEQHKGVRACVPFLLSAAVLGDAARGRMYTRSRLWSAACPALRPGRPLPASPCLCPRARRPACNPVARGGRGGQGHGGGLTLRQESRGAAAPFPVRVRACRRPRVRMPGPKLTSDRRESGPRP